MNDVSSSHRTTRRYLALFFPWLPAERLRITRPHLFAGRVSAPYALTEKVKNALRLHAIDPEAARLGLERGMTLADARARLPELEAFEHVPHDDHLWLERLADGCIRYTPWVMFDAPDGLGIYQRIMTEAPRSLRTLRADVVPALDAVVLQCLARKVAVRIADAQAMLDALAPFATEAR